jgi:hypothetical protein
MSNPATNNSIDAGLKRAQILQTAVKEFSRRALPLKAFASVFTDTPLQGDDTVRVPYYPLQNAASSSFDYTTTDGYVFGQSTDTQAKTITVNKRIYQPLDFSSQEMCRQPMLKLEELAALAAQKLAYDVLTDILSAITVANYPAIGLTRPAAAISSDDLADLSGACSDANWPISGRSLIVGTGYDTQLKKDPSIKLALNINGTEVARQGVVPNIAGFNYHHLPNFPHNSEALGGIAVHQSALAVAFAPIVPAPAVRGQLYAYETVTDAETGISLSYRVWGDPTRDRNCSILEASYGYAVLNPAALKRITFA